MDGLLCGVLQTDLKTCWIPFYIPLDPQASQHHKINFATTLFNFAPFCLETLFMQPRFPGYTMPYNSNKRQRPFVFSPLMPNKKKHRRWGYKVSEEKKKKRNEEFMQFFKPSFGFTLTQNTKTRQKKEKRKRKRGELGAIREERTMAKK